MSVAPAPAEPNVAENQTGAEPFGGGASVAVQSAPNGPGSGRVEADHAKSSAPSSRAPSSEKAAGLSEGPYTLRMPARARGHAASAASDSAVNDEASPGDEVEKEEEEEDEEEEDMEEDDDAEEEEEEGKFEVAAADAKPVKAEGSGGCAERAAEAWCCTAE